MKIGIYGGSFNPIHNGHLALARQFLSQAGLDAVWFVVSPQNPFKISHALLDDAERLRLVRLALEHEPQMRASDIEFRLPKPSYMWNTLQQLSADYPDHEFLLLIGGDNWTRFDRWYHAKDILRNYRIAVYPRKDDPIDASSLPSNVLLLEAELLNISSTDIRRRIAEGKPVGRMVPSAVADEVVRLYSGIKSHAQEKK